MKKTLLIIFALMISVGLSACGGTSEKNDAGKTMAKKTTHTEKKAKKTKGLKEFKTLKECLVKASSKTQALDCYRELENFTNDKAAAINTGVNEWTAQDKEKVLKQTDTLIKMLEMQK